MRKKAFIYIILAGILWGTSGIFVNILSPFGFTQFHMTSMRGCVAAIIMSAYVLCKNKSLFKVHPKELLLFALSGISVFGTSSCYYGAIRASSVSTAVVLMYTAPVFVMAFSVVFLGEKLNKIKLLSIIMVMLGSILVSGVIGEMKFGVLGVVLGLSSGLCYSAYNVLTKIEMMHKSNSTSATVYSFIFMAIVSTAFCNPGDMFSIIASTPSDTIPLVLGIGVVTCVLPYFLYTLALKDIPVGTAAAMGIIEPVSATLFSVMIFKERLSIFSATGIILVLLAVFLISKSDR